MRTLGVSFLLHILALGSECLDTHTARMAVDYFSYKDIKLICCFTCTSAKWLRNFSLLASEGGMRVSAAATSRACAVELAAAVGVLLDPGCAAAAAVLEQSSQEKRLDAMHKWLIVELPDDSEVVILTNASDSKYPTGHNSTIKENSPDVRAGVSVALLEPLNISIDAEITVAYRIGSTNRYELFDVYNFGKVQGGTLNVTSMGRWTAEDGLEIWLNSYKYLRRWDFHGLILRTVTVMLIRPDKFEPELLTRQEYTPGVAMLTKVTSTVLDLIREQHNFRLNYTIADRWIGPTERNSALAVSNSLFWQQQDVSSTAMRLSASSWLDWVDVFSPPTAYVETKFYYRIPSEGVGKFENEFLRPFSSPVWWCLGCAGALCAAALAAAARAEARPKALQFACFSVVATFCQQLFEDGYETSPATGLDTSRQVALIITGFSSLLLYNYYTSSVVSWLLSAPPPTIASLDELIRSSLEVVLEDIGYTRSWLEVPGYYYSRNRSPKEDELREKKAKIRDRKKPVLQTVDEGIELVRRGGFAYHTEPYSANVRIGRTFSEQELCDLGALQMMELVPVYLVGQRRSAYREFFFWSTIRALERGHVSYARRRVSVPEPECAGSTPRALSLGGAAPAFLVLAICGWGAASVLLLCEILVHRNTLGNPALLEYTP